MPSRWDEPFGRSSLEASSRGCALVISNKGGLKETTSNALILKNVNENEIYEKIKLLIFNKKKRLKLQKDTYRNFYLTNDYVSKLIDDKRINSFLNLNSKKHIKILHITNLNERFDGRLHYNTGKRINNGFVRLGHNVLTLSDRDTISQSRSLTDMSGIKTLNKKIYNTVNNFRPDLIVLGHADNITKENIFKIKKLYNPKICQWFLDPLMKNGPDFIRNKKRISNIDKIIDATFVTTHPSKIIFNLKNAYYMPNPCDESFEILNNYKTNPKKDLFFAMSHGVHRGVLKGGKYDDREFFLKKLKQKIPNIKFDIFGMDNVQPIWGEKFLNNLKNYKMALNLSRGKPIKYYSSDRIVQLVGNGLLTFLDEKTQLKEILSDKGVIYYKNINDLAKKILYFKKNNKKLKKISLVGKKEYFKKFNSNIIGKYIIDKSFNKKSFNKYYWN